MTDSGSSYVHNEGARRFYKWRRRDECNPFNAMFYDRETVTEAQIQQRVEAAARFFGLPVPVIAAGCGSLAQITYTDCPELGSEIRYDPSKLQDIGINNLDAFDATLTHELAHQFMDGATFSLCRNADWCKELACDFMAGARCKAAYIASGKYRYAVSMMKASDTHPPGRFRLRAVESGFEFAQWLSGRGVTPTAQAVMMGVNQFMCAHSKALNEALAEYVSQPHAPSRPTDVMSLPDTNLIKQYLLRHKSIPPQSS